ncbi:MAG: hypothetical protein K8T90_15515 [Planctomycetes bacterium]|nr:hypothetical protein [Planctomycetota bacterium]
MRSSIRRSSTGPFRTVALAVAAAAVAAAALAPLLVDGPAAAQDRSGNAARNAAPPPAAAPTPSDSHKIRGVLAWRRAVWTSDPASYLKAVKELEQARALGPAAPDLATLFLLGMSYARSGSPAKAEEPLRAAREAFPAFPGHLLAEAIRVTGERPGYHKQDGTIPAIEILDAYLVDIARYDAKAPFAAELRYLGYLERGLRMYAIEHHDLAIRDLGQALALTRAEGRTPAAELVRTLSQAHRTVSEFDLAESTIREALGADPGEPSHYLVLGMVAADGNHLDRAREWYARAAARRADYAEPRAKLAYLGWESGDLDTMRRQLEAYEYLTTESWQANPATRSPGLASNLRAGWGTYWLARGERLTESGDLVGAKRMWERARLEFARALQETPGCIRALNSMIQVLSRLQAPQPEIDEYTRRLEQIRQGAPDAPPAYRETFC